MGLEIEQPVRGRRHEHGHQLGPCSGQRGLPGSKRGRPVGCWASALGSLHAPVGSSCLPLQMAHQDTPGPASSLGRILVHEAEWTGGPESRPSFFSREKEVGSGGRELPEGSEL